MTSCKISVSSRLAPELGAEGEGGGGIMGAGGGVTGGDFGVGEGGDSGGGGGATARGSSTPSVTDTGAAETTLTPRLLERAATGCATKVLASAASSVLFPGPASGMMRVAATLTLPAEMRRSRRHAGA